MVPIIVDTREQDGWFSGNTDCVRRTLTTGDYSLVGFEDRICIERKNLGDLVHSVVGDWMRFVKCLRRLAAFDAAMIAIEATPEDIYEHRYRSESNPESVMGRCASITIDYGVPVCFVGKRPYSERYAESFLRLAWEKLK